MLCKIMLWQMLTISPYGELIVIFYHYYTACTLSVQYVKYVVGHRPEGLMFEVQRPNVDTQIGLMCMDGLS